MRSQSSRGPVVVSATFVLTALSRGWRAPEDLIVAIPQLGYGIAWEQERYARFADWRGEFERVVEQARAGGRLHRPPAELEDYLAASRALCERVGLGEAAHRGIVRRTRGSFLGALRRELVAAGFRLLDFDGDRGPLESTPGGEHAGA